MLTVEEKLQHFSQLVLNQAQKQKADILSRAEAECRSMEEAHENKCLEQAYRGIQKRIASINREMNERVSKAQTACRQQLLARRGQMTDEVFAAVCQKLRAFKQTPAYQELLFQWIQAGMAEVQTEPSGAIIAIDASDAAHKSAVEAAFPGAAVELLPEDSIGGVRIRAKNGAAVADYTLASRLREERQRFLLMSGLRV